MDVVEHKKSPGFDWGTTTKKIKDPRWISAPWSEREVNIEPSTSLQALDLNEREFLIVNRSNKLFKYDTRTDKLTPFLSLPPSCAVKENFLDLDYCRMQIDRTNNRIFLLTSITPRDIFGIPLGPHKTKVTTSIIDIPSGSLIRQISKDPDDSDEIIEMYPTMVSVNGTMHKVGGPHTIWNEDKLDWEPINVKAAYLDVHEDIADVCLVHVPSKNCVLMLGGNDDSFSFDEDSVDKSTGIWRYCVRSGLWEQMKDDEGKPFMFVDNPEIHQILLSSNERFVIIAPEQRESLYVLDIGDDNQYKLWESSVQLPKQMEFITKSGGLSESKSLVFGWMRRQKDFGLVPIVIKTLISKWCSVEMIHSFNYAHCRQEDGAYDRSHEKIMLTDVLCPKL